MWFPWAIFVVVNLIFIVALVAVVRRQLRWEDTEGKRASEEIRRTVRINYRIVVAVVLGAYLFFLGTAIFYYFVLRDMNLI